MHWGRTPLVARYLIKDVVWRISPRKKKELYLTFDDGPTPGVTDDVLQLLATYSAKATFFCLGTNIQKHPELYQKIVETGHSIGNHTFDHINGWKTNNFTYFRSYLKCAEVMKSDLFRPPFGRIKRSQLSVLKKHTRIIMWDVLSGDYNIHRTPDQCLSTVIKHAKEGSIVLFHDSPKAHKNVTYALEGTLQHFSNLGYSFKSIR